MGLQNKLYFLFLRFYFLSKNKHYDVSSPFKPIELMSAYKLWYNLGSGFISAARLRMQQSNYKNQKEGKAISFAAWGTKRPKFSAKRSFWTLKITWDWFSDHQKHDRLYFLQKVTGSWLVGHWSNHRKLSKRCKKTEKVTFCKRS